MVCQLRQSRIRGNLTDGGDDGNIDGEDAETGEESPESPDTDNPADAGSGDGGAGTDDDPEDGSESGVDEENGSSEEEDSSDARDEDEDSDGANTGDADESTKPGADGNGDVNDDDASDDGVVSTDSDDGTEPELDEDGETDEATEDEDVDRMSRASDIGINAVIDDGLYLYDVTWNDDAGQATIGLEIEAGFAADVGDTFIINYTSDSLSLAASQPAISGLPVTISVNSGAESVTLTFSEDFSVSDATTFELVLNGEVQFPACLPGDGEQVNGANIGFWSSTSSARTFVQGENCVATQHPAIERVEFMPEMDALEITLDIPNTEVEPGFEATITYQQDKINIPNGTTTEFYMGGPDVLNPVSVATAVANDGLITITFHDIEYDGENWDRYYSGFLGATLESVACVDVTERDFTDLGRLFFVASPGGTFVSYIDVALCNAAPASKTGVLSEDGTEVYWAIDSGDLINGGSIQDGFLITGQQFDCESIDVTLNPPSSQGWYDVDCGWEEDRYDSGFAVYFGGEGPVRAIVTVTGIVEQEFSFGSVLNCATVSAGGREMPTALNTRDNNAGWGTTVCAEVHTAGIGDSITNTVSSPTIYQGEALTYAVSFETTTGLWLVMSLDDVLPQGFDVTSVTCTFSPSNLAEGACETGEDNTISVGLNRFTEMEDGPDSLEGGQITLTIEGVVTADPGTELVSQACGVRAFEIPGMPPVLSQIGSGTVCASTSTMVLQVPVETPTPEPTIEPTETPTPDPTIEPTETPTTEPTETVEPDPTETVEPDLADPDIPATPGVTPTTPGATPTSPTDPGTESEAESAVTGLPSTGQGSSSAGTAIVISAMAASMLIATAFGVRIRSPRA